MDLFINMCASLATNQPAKMTAQEFIMYLVFQNNNRYGQRYGFNQDAFKQDYIFKLMFLC